MTCKGMPEIVNACDKYTAWIEGRHLSAKVKGYIMGSQKEHLAISPSGDSIRL
jgi:hypothetical protein